SSEDLKGLRYRTVGIAADLFRGLGAAVTPLPSGEIAAVMDRNLLDGAEVNNPSSDLSLGLPDVAKVYMLASHHRQAQAFEVIVKRTRFSKLAPELTAILRHAALAASCDHLAKAYDRYSKDLAEIRKRGVQVVRAGDAVLSAELKVWSQIVDENAKEPFFAKVLASQQAWVKRTQPYLHINNLGTSDLAA